MSDYERYNSEPGGGFLMGLLAGTVLGAGIGMLLAPKSGQDLRGQLGEQARNLSTKASEQYRRASETAGNWAERGRDVMNQARDAVQRGVDEARGSGYTSSTPGSSGYPGSSTSTPGSFGGNSGSDYGRS